MTPSLGQKIILNMIKIQIYKSHDSNICLTDSWPLIKFLVCLIYEYVSAVTQMLSKPWSDIWFIEANI